MSTAREDQSHPPLGRAIEGITIIAMALMVVAIIATAGGVNGLRLTGGPDGEGAAITIDAEVMEPIAMVDELPIIVDGSGRESVFGQAPVRASSSIVTLELLDPTPGQRGVWVAWQIAGPLLGLLIAWSLLQLVRSSRLGDPFTRANERRLWRIAALAGTGGIAYSVLAGMAKTFIVQRSAAADLFAIVFEVSFLPIAAGMVVAALAGVWRVGVTLREDAEATI